jgi:hypothetical protein
MQIRQGHRMSHNGLIASVRPPLTTSNLPPTADITHQGRRFRKVPRAAHQIVISGLIFPILSERLGSGGTARRMLDRRGHGTGRTLRGSPESSERQLAFPLGQPRKRCPKLRSRQSCRSIQVLRRSRAGSNCGAEAPRRTCRRTNHILCEADTKRQGGLIRSSYSR